MTLAVTGRKAMIHAANPACSICGCLVRSIRECMVTGGDEVQRVAHLGCFVRAILKVNPTFNQSAARARAGVNHGHLSS